MEILYVLLPVSVVLVLVILGVLAWAIFGGQFEGLEQEGLRILHEGNNETGTEVKNLDLPQD
ncbi:MAG: cbb3-type cytochrome oxidase assembly protein CcoS [Burkholderiales bacterium]|nr:cbb3-type cytochrome oxidase assembly protein CcoS [Burkholderiales bacterium]